jgi:hypothetical protein
MFVFLSLPPQSTVRVAHLASLPWPRLVPSVHDTIIAT